MKKIGDILSSDTDFAHIKRESKHLDGMNAVILQTLAENGIHPADCRIAEFNNGELRLQGAFAADIFRIRQILPTLQDSLKKSGFNIISIRATVGGGAYK